MNDYNKINGETIFFGCIACPSNHVRAPTIFNKFFIEKKINALMIPLDVSPENLSDVINGLKKINKFKGMAVTIPHKLQLAKLCDYLSESAKATNAVNIIKFDNNGLIYGENFDGAGFVLGLKGEGYDLNSKKILLVGAGGAARGISLALGKENVLFLDIINRTEKNAHDLVNLYKNYCSKNNIKVVNDKNVDYAKYDLVINTTSLGLSENDELPFELKYFNKNCLVCDIIMNPSKTKLIKSAISRGLNFHYGRHMLDYQFILMTKFFSII